MTDPQIAGTAPEPMGPAPEGAGLSQPLADAAAALPTAPRSATAGPTRISGTWVGIVVGAVVLVLLLVFVLQNKKSVKVSFFTANGHLPLGVALLFAVVGGVLLAAGAGSLRILQIRHRLRKAGSQAAAQPAPSVPAAPAGAFSPVAPADPGLGLPQPPDQSGPSIQGADNIVGQSPIGDREVN